ncbi:S8 family serine peptidase [Streptomyces acidicola]|uniref:S8 family serine peptidase n=1 Tax=Streptomyces acidicola TaxID=2596892 RepID=UPI00380C6A1B
MRSDRYRRAVLPLVAAAALPILAAPPVSAADDGPVSLPALRSRLAADESCATGSGKKAEESPWTRQALQLSRAWQLSKGGDITVGVVDTGVNGNVPALTGRVTAQGSAGTDCVGHGSFVAGLIAGAPTGTGAVSGVAPGARILAVRGTDERGAATAQQVAAGITSAVDQGAKVVYVGQALTTGGTLLAQAVAHASSKDVLVVAPAAPDIAPTGTDGRPDPRARAYWPARVPRVLSVVDYGPNGARPDNAPSPLAPDLAAPGDAVVGIGPRGAGHYIGSGSSLAAAHVAGAAALVRSYHPDLSATEVSRRLTEAAYPGAVPRLDTYAGLTAVLGDNAGQGEPKADPAHVPPAEPASPRNRALLIAGGGGGVVLLVAAGAVIIPRGKARNWRPAG